MSQGPRILIADDDWQVQRAVTRAAAADGYQVIHVTNGNDLLQRAIETNPHLIILDISFPDADGRDLLASLKADARTADIPVLVWSGAARDHESARKIALGLGAEDYVEKVDSGTLLRKVRRVLLRFAEERGVPSER
jgi:two-component system KDP operon response regulator KdpE